jgi:hypothetical protein
MGLFELPLYGEKSSDADLMKNIDNVARKIDTTKLELKMIKNDNYFNL